MSEEQNNEALNKAMEEPVKIRKIFHRNNDSWIRERESAGKESLMRSHTIILDIESIDVMYILDQYLRAKRDTDLIVRAELGIALVHPKDQFSRKAGREQALKVMKPVDLKVTDIYIDEDKINVNVGNDEFAVSFNLVRYKDSGTQRIKLNGFHTLTVLEKKLHRSKK